MSSVWKSDLAENVWTKIDPRLPEVTFPGFGNALFTPAVPPWMRFVVEKSVPL